MRILRVSKFLTRSKWQMIVLWIISLSFIFNSFTLNSCGSPPAKPYISLNGIMPQTWQDNLAKWLELSYIQTTEIAGFSMYPSDFLEQPDLETTHAAIRIVCCFNKLEEQTADGIAQWVVSLLNEEGYYTNPHGNDINNSFSNIQYTEMAINTLNTLNIVPTSSKTIDYLLSSQQNDGWFAFGSSSIETTSSLIAATNSILLTLTDLGYYEWDKLERTHTTLKNYLNDRFAGDSSLNINAQETGRTILAIWSLALINPDSVPYEAKQFITNCLRDIAKENFDVLMVDRIYNVLKAVNCMHLTIPEDIIGNLKILIATKIFPLQNNNGFIADLDSISKIIWVASQINLPIPNSNKILDLLKSHKINGGWVPFGQMNLNNKEQHTYYALELSRRVAYHNFDKSLIINYLKQNLYTSTKLQNMYYLLLDQKLLDSNTFGDLLDSIKSKTFQLARNLTDDLQNLSEWYYFSLICDERFNVPEDIEQNMIDLAKNLKSELSSGSVLKSPYSIYVLCLVQKCLKTDKYLTNTELFSLMEPFRVETGGYKGRINVDYADIHSTYWAIKALGVSKENTEALWKFVMSCEGNYGFYNISVKKESLDRLLVSDFWSTYEALVLLDLCKK